MKRFVFFSMPGYGHTHPTLSLAKELVKRGHKVTYYSLPEFRPMIEAAGVTYRKYPGMFDTDARIARNFAYFGIVIMTGAEKLLPELIKDMEKEKPDCIAYDAFAIWGKAVAHRLDIPAVTLFTTIAFSGAVFRKNFPTYLSTVVKAVQAKQVIFQAYHKYLMLAKNYHFQPNKFDEFLFSRESSNIVFTSSYFQPAAKYFAKSFHFVGPAMSARKEDTTLIKKLNPKQKLIYISVGTIFNDNLAFFKLCIETFANTDFQVVLAIGHRFSVDQFSDVPANIIIQNYIPQLAILQKAAVFITHAGMNSINESAYHGVPMILIPQMDEQAINARRVQELGAGILLTNKKLSSKLLLETVEKIVAEKSFYDNVAKLQKSLHDTHGEVEAANILEQRISATI